VIVIVVRVCISVHLIPVVLVDMICLPEIAIAIAIASVPVQIPIFIL
jgi:hypothetical protein